MGTRYVSATVTRYNVPWEESGEADQYRLRILAERIGWEIVNEKLFTLKEVEEEIQTRMTMKVFVLDPDSEQVGIEGQNERMKILLEAVLRFHEGGEWTAEKGAWWGKNIGQDATTKALCDAIRKELKK